MSKREGKGREEETNGGDWAGDCAGDVPDGGDCAGCDCATDDCAGGKLCQYDCVVICAAQKFQACGCH